MVCPLIRAANGLSNTVLVWSLLTTLLFEDLWGRGYSDTPAEVPHDARLFATQILFAIASSSLSWNGAASGGFSIIAFSLGGGICMSFAAHFPYLVNSIVLLAPGGILRYLPKEYETTLVRYHYLVPSKYLRRVVGNILGVNLSNSPLGHTNPVDQDQTGPEVSQDAKLLRQGVLDISAIVQWQFDYHKGFVHSFINTIEHGPLTHQHADWEKACNVIKGDTIKSSASSRSSRLFNSRILVIFGDNDGVVVEKHVSDDLSEMIGGSEHVEFKVVPGGHGFPVPSSEEVVRHISEFWGLQANA
jgi:pimeloyl-ACP methyl ester carboxylesterase